MLVFVPLRDEVKQREQVDPDQVDQVPVQGRVVDGAEMSGPELAAQGTPQEVMDDAMWGVFQEGWRDGFGADADHLKTVDDIKITHEAGFTMFTADPSEKINNRADTMSSSELDSAYGALFKTEKESSSLLKKYAKRKFKGLKISFSENNPGRIYSFVRSRNIYWFS